MNKAIFIGPFDLFISIGILQGVMLAVLFLKKGGRENKPNFFQGLLLLFLVLAILEELLNNTGYIVRLLTISDFSEPLNFTFAALVYLHIKSSLEDEKKTKDWIHFIPAMFWLLYMIFYFIQPDALKYNSYIATKHPDWEYLKVTLTISDDPLGIRRFVNQLTIVHFVIYLGLSLQLILRKLKAINQSFFAIKNKLLKILRNTILHYLVILVIFITTKLYFGMESDIGGYFIATYISFMFFITSYQIMYRSDYFSVPNSFMEFPRVKYERSSLSETDKNRIQAKLKHAMEEEMYFKNNLASLAGLSQKVRENRHHVSQVINETFGKSFFEFIAEYRIEEAKKILLADIEKKITVEELADMVGYNAKSSFNSAFKKYTGQTPTDFRQQTR